jgi:transposase
MAKPLLTDELWLRIEPLLPRQQPKPKGGRPPIPNRNALTGILFIMRTGCPWEYLPKELGCGSGMTCWRRLRDWHLAGVWEKVWRVLLDELGLANEIDWSKVALDSCSVRALLGGADRAKPHRSRQTWLEAACCLRRPGDAACDHSHRRQRP